MPLRTVLIWAQRVALALAATAMITTLFILGHTETFSTRFTVFMCVTSGVSALILAMLHIIGLPKDENAQKSGRRSRGR